MRNTSKKIVYLGAQKPIAMKTTILFMFFVFMCAITIKTFAQGSGAKADPRTTLQSKEIASNRAEQSPPSGGGLPESRLELKGVEGEIYVGENWPAGTIVLRDGGKIENYLLRYNILVDQMQFIVDKDTLAFASPQELSTLTFDNHTFIYEAYQCDNTIRYGYFELIENGKNKLLLKRLVTFEMPDAKNPVDADATKYFIDECYFISKPGKASYKIMCNRKSALSVLNEHQDEIDEYLRITGNKVKTPDDLKKLVSYYNTLDD
jgi:hypothetical protein